MNDAMLICARCRNAEYVSNKFVGKKFFCHKCGNLAVVVDAENLKKFDLEKLNIKIDTTSDNKFIVNEDETDQNEAKEAISQKYKEMIINEINSTSEPHEKKEEPVVEEPNKYDDLFVPRFFNSLYTYLRDHTKANEVTEVNNFCVRGSQYVAFLVAACLIVVGSITGYRTKAYQVTVISWCLSALMLTSQFIAISSFELIRKLEKKTLGTYSSKVIFRNNAILTVFLILALLSFSCSYLVAFRPISLYFFSIDTAYHLIMLTLLLLFVLWFLLMVFIHAKELFTLTFDPKLTAAEEFLHVCSINIKGLLKIAPIMYFAGCLHVGSVLAYECSMVVVNKNATELVLLENTTLHLFAITLFLPFFLYYFALLAHFLIEAFSNVVLHTTQRGHDHKLFQREESPQTPEANKEEHPA